MTEKPTLRPLMWKEALLRFKPSSGAPGPQFCLGEEAGALAPPQQGASTLCRKWVAVAKPVQAHARQAGRSL